MSERYPLKNTDLEIFPVVLGSVSAGNEIDDKLTDKIIGKYLDLGGNVLDSARMYVHGESEKMLGRWFRSSGKRNDMVLITKGGHPRVETMHTGRMTEADMRSDIEESLRALQTDYIDLYFFHRDDLNQPVGESLEIMEKFVREGKIRYYGCSNWSAARIRESFAYAGEHGLRGFAANQMLFNIASEHMKPFPDDTMAAMDADMMQVHREFPILSMPYFGVCSGFFYILKARGEDAVRNSPYYTPENLKIAKRVFELADAYNTNITTVLLRFFFAQDFANCPLYGPTMPAQLDDLNGFFDVPFKRSDFCFEN